MLRRLLRWPVRLVRRIKRRHQERLTRRERYYFFRLTLTQPELSRPRHPSRWPRWVADQRWEVTS